MAPYLPSAAAAAGRADFATIAAWIAPNARVLDLGCGDGSLLAYLQRERGVRGYGIEIDDAGVLACIGNGVNVLQSDLESGLAGFDDASFDCVILSQTLQAMRHTEDIVNEMLRVGREAIVTFPELRPLDAPAADPARPDAGVVGAALPVVRHAQHPSLHRRRFRCFPRRAAPHASKTGWSSPAAGRCPRCRICAASSPSIASAGPDPASHAAKTSPVQSRR